MARTEPYDAVVIGAGHNGLVCGATLAKAGLRTLILERRPIVGGACVTEEVWPGFHVSTTSYVLSMFPGRIIKELQLKRFGFELIPADNLFVPFEDGRYMVLWDDISKTCQEIAKFSERDADRYPGYEAFLQTAAGFVRELMWKTPPSSAKPRAAMDAAFLLWKFKKMGHQAPRFIDLMTLSVADFLDRWFESDQLKATLAYYGSIGTFKGPMTPGSAYVLLHHLMGEHEGAGGWGFVRGGMGGLTQALSESAKHFGATILTDCEVARVEIRGEQAVGVTLANGATYKARAVVSNADPKTTYLRLIGRENLHQDVVSEVESFNTFSTAFKINFALDRLPEYTAFDKAKLGPYPTYVHLGPTIEYLERAYDDAKYGRPSTRPFLSPVVPTLADRSLAPEGKHILNVFGGHAPYELVGTTWDEQREAFADRVVDTLAEFAPKIRDAIIDRQILMPPDLERIYGLPQGHIFHGELSLDQLFLLRPIPGYADYRTPVRGLYLCGSGTHPGGGVSGVPGHNAAGEILRDWRRASQFLRRRLGSGGRQVAASHDGSKALAEQTPTVERYGLAVREIVEP
jgi:phytoene dehydrogenase-like protein